INLAEISCILGFQGVADSLHHAAAESLLRSRRAFPSDSECREKSRFYADYEPKLYSRSQEDCKCMGAWSYKYLNSLSRIIPQHYLASMGLSGGLLLYQLEAYFIVTYFYSYFKLR